jgi:hypothetical protein
MCLIVKNKIKSWFGILGKGKVKVNGRPVKLQIGKAYQITVKDRKKNKLHEFTYIWGQYPDFDDMLLAMGKMGCYEVEFERVGLVAELKPQQVKSDGIIDSIDDYDPENYVKIPEANKMKK